jgi:hypothetical protein
VSVRSARRASEQYFRQRAQLEQLLRRNRNDVDTWLAYGKLLRTKGDPRGELIWIEYALRRLGADRALERRREAARQRVVGQLAGLEVAFDWHWGLLRGVSFDVWRLTDPPDNVRPQSSVSAMLAAILRAACGRVLEQVQINLRGGSKHLGLDLDRALRLLGRSTVTRLMLINGRPSAIRRVLTNAQRQLGGIEALCLDDCRVGPRGVRVLRQARNVYLKELELQACKLDDRAAGEILSTPHLEGLRRLDLSMNPLGDSFASQLAGAAHLKRLVFLDLRHTSIGDAGAHALAAAPHLASLGELRLWSTQIGTAGWQVLRDSPYLSAAVKRDYPARHTQS